MNPTRKPHQLFGAELPEFLDKLNEALVAGACWENYSERSRTRRSRRG